MTKVAEDKSMFTSITISREGDYEIAVSKPIDEDSNSWEIRQGSDDNAERIFLPDEKAVKALIAAINRLVAGK